MEELKKGFKINEKYIIHRLQGEGILGSSVYLGQESESKNDIIIRILPSTLHSDSETVSRFMHGAKLAQKLDHPNILKVIDFGSEDGVNYLITNYEKGFFLNDYLEHRGNLDENESVKLIISLADALKYAWEDQKIIHRNICPDSVYIAKSNNPMLTDFEIAKSLMESEILTLEGQAIGDPRYMSPEQVQGEDVDFRSDIYCLGLVFYQFLTGAPPFNDKAMAKNLKGQLAEKHPSISLVRNDISKKCISIIDKMLEKQPDKRYQSWARLIDDLSSLLPSTNENSNTKKYQIEAVKLDDIQTKKGSPAKKFSLIILALIIVSGIIYFVKDSKKNDKPAVTNKPPKVIAENKPATEVKQSPKSQNKAKDKVETKVAAEIQKANDIAKAELAKKAQDAKDVAEAKAKDVATAQKNKIAAEAIIMKHRKACMYNIKQIGEALQMYANIYEGKYPAFNNAKGLDQLKAKGILRIPQVFICPASGKLSAASGKSLLNTTCDYIYAGGYSAYSNAKTPILWSNPANHKDYGIILYANGDIKEYSGNNWLSKTKVTTKLNSQKK